MWRIPFFLMFFFAANAAHAARCFDPVGRETSECPKQWSSKLSNGSVILMDEKGTPLAKAIVVPGAKKKDPERMGVADVSGREIAAPRFDRVYAVSRNLAVGELILNPKDPVRSQRAFLIDLKSGEIRATPWRSIWPTDAGDADGPPYLLGVDPATFTAPYNVAILEASGGDTGLREKAVNPFVFRTMPRTLPYNLIGIGDRKMNAYGEEQFVGQKLYEASGWGYFVEGAPPPPGMVKGPEVGPLLTPLASDGTPQALPADTIGMIKGGVYLFTIRRTPKGVRFYEHQGGKPVLAARPAGEGFLDLYLVDHMAMVRTASGWMDPYVQKPFPTAEAAAAARRAELKAFVAQVMEEERTKVQRKAAAEAKAKADSEAALQAWRTALRTKMQDIKAGKLGGFPSLDLQREVMAAQLEGTYEAIGLTFDPAIKRQICWQRQSVICSRSATSTSSGSGFVSTWEKAFENARALNQRQYQENCAAASKGASRACTTY